MHQLLRLLSGVQCFLSLCYVTLCFQLSVSICNEFYFEILSHNTLICTYFAGHCIIPVVYLYWFCVMFSKVCELQKSSLFFFNMLTHSRCFCVPPNSHAVSSSWANVVVWGTVLTMGLDSAVLCDLYRLFPSFASVVITNPLYFYLLLV